jgi:predicted outer membrane repeat protein
VEDTTFNNNDNVASLRGGTVAFRRVDLFANEGVAGNAVVFLQVPTLFEDVHIADTTAFDTSTGAVVYASSSSDTSAELVCSRCTFEDNTATQGPIVFVQGGASIQVNESTFARNASQATVRSQTTSASFADTTFTDNAGVDGGAIDFVLNAGTATPVRILDSTFSGNTASGNGGAIRSGAFVRLDMVDSGFTNNTAGNDGGAIWSIRAVDAVNTTFVGNSATGIGEAVFMDNLSGPSLFDGGSITGHAGSAIRFLHSTVILGGVDVGVGGTANTPADLENGGGTTIDAGDNVVFQECGSAGCSPWSPPVDTGAP